MAHRSSSSIARSAACLGSGSENSPALPFDWHMSNELFVLLFFPSHFSYFIFFLVPLTCERLGVFWVIFLLVQFVCEIVFPPVIPQVLSAAHTHSSSVRRYIYPTACMSSLQSTDTELWVSFSAFVTRFLYLFDWSAGAFITFSQLWLSGVLSA